MVARLGGADAAAQKSSLWAPVGPCGRRGVFVTLCRRLSSLAVGWDR